MHEIKTEVDRDDLVSEKHAYHSYEGTEDDDHWRQTQPGRSKQGRNSLENRARDMRDGNLSYCLTTRSSMNNIMG